MRNLFVSTAISVFLTLAIIAGAVYGFRSLSDEQVSWLLGHKFGTTITTILGTDQISASRTTINTNFANLNTGKIEVGTTSVASIVTLSGLTTADALSSATSLGTVSTLLRLGGATSAFVAWKRSGTQIQARLGDDSNYANFIADTIQAANIFTTSGDYRINSSSRLLAPSNGIWEMLNNAGTDFSRLQLGGTTSSFPALQITTATQSISIGLADGTAGGRFGVASTSPAFPLSVNNAGSDFYVTTTGKTVAQDTANVWSGRISPTHSLVLQTGTTTTWTASTTGAYVPFVIAPFSGTIRQTYCKTDASFLGVQVQVNGADITPKYFIASTTAGNVLATGSNTFVKGDKISLNAGTTTTASTTSISCTVDATETI